MTIDDNGYPIYRRRDDGRFIQKRDFKLEMLLTGMTHGRAMIAQLLYHI